jgi:cytochrome c oxidase subunit 2
MADGTGRFSHRSCRALIAGARAVIHRSAPMRLALAGIASAALFACGMQIAAQTTETPSASDAPVRVIKIAARRFVYTPAEIVLKKDQPVAFELTTQDFGHGFSIPDLDFRADFVPDRTNIVRLTPRKAGRFDFLCDNFCGSGHEEMDGKLIVEE